MYGEYKKAEDILGKALHMAREANVEGHEDTLYYMTQLPRALLDQDPNEETEEYVRKCLRLAKSYAVRKTIELYAVGATWANFF